MTPTPKIAAVLTTCIGAAWMGKQFGTVLKQKDGAIDLLLSINSSINNFINICFEYTNKHIKNIISLVNGKYGF
jgi:hypothetical protein